MMPYLPNRLGTGMFYSGGIIIGVPKHRKRQLLAGWRWNCCFETPCQLESVGRFPNPGTLCKAVSGTSKEETSMEFCCCRAEVLLKARDVDSVRSPSLSRVGMDPMR